MESTPVQHVTPSALQLSSAIFAQALEIAFDDRDLGVHHAKARHELVEPDLHVVAKFTGLFVEAINFYAQAGNFFGEVGFCGFASRGPLATEENPVDDQEGDAD